MNPESAGGEHSPQPERIKYTPDALRPPEKNLRLSYIVPIRGEVNNGNFFLQLRDFTNQSRIAKDAYEVIYVRNNPPKDIATQSPAIAENQTILDTIKYIQGSSEIPPDHLEDWQTKIVEAAKHKKLRVQTMQIDPNGLKGNNEKGENIEAARIEGENVAKERFTAINFDGGIVILDADTRFHRDTSSKIDEQLLQTPKVGMMRIAYDLFPGEGGEKLYEVSAHDRFVNSQEVFTLTLGGRTIKQWYAVRTSSLPIRSSLPRQSLSGERDWIRPQQGGQAVAHDIRVYVQHRAIPEKQGGEYSREVQRKIERPTSAQANAFFPDHRSMFHTAFFIGPNKIRPELQDIRTRLKNLALQPQESSTRVTAREYADMTRSIILSLTENPEEPEELNKYIEDAVDYEKKRQAYVVGKVKTLLAKAYTLPPGNTLSIDDLQSTPGQKSLYAHFLRQNLWIVQAIQDSRSANENPEAAFQTLQQKFPDFLSPLETTEYTYPTAMMLGMIKYIEDGKLH